MPSTRCLLAGLAAAQSPKAPSTCTHTYANTDSDTNYNSDAYAHSDTYAGADYAQCARLQGAGEADGGPDLDRGHVEQR
jgi:hypothetical protein